MNTYRSVLTYRHVYACRFERWPILLLCVLVDTRCALYSVRVIHTQTYNRGHSLVDFYHAVIIYEDLDSPFFIKTWYNGIKCL